MEPWQTREWFAEYLDVCNAHDLDALREFVDPQVRRAHLPGGVDAWIDDMADLFHAFPDWRWRRIQLVIEDDRIAAHLRGSGTHSGVFHGLSATRRHVNVAEFGIYRIAGGRIVEHADSEPHLRIRAQLEA